MVRSRKRIKEGGGWSSAVEGVRILLAHLFLGSVTDGVHTQNPGSKDPSFQPGQALSAP